MKKINLYIYYGLLIFFVIIVSPLPSQGIEAALEKGSTGATMTGTYGEKLGVVRFPASCSNDARQHLNRGLALLHNMTYEDSRVEFKKAVQADPECAMGYWGQAMTYIHPLWSDPPDEIEFTTGQELVTMASTTGKKKDWELAYVTAVDAYYSAGRNENEKKNLANFEMAWEKNYQQFPKDVEAASFYALSHLATADPADKTYSKQKQAGLISEKVLAEVPNHPGAHHYIIHAYDYSKLADRALTVARSYGKLAPDVPHSLHMPTHILTRLGYWDESIAMNKRSAKAALKHPVKGQVSLHYLHALDYMAYAYLQKGQDHEAEEVLKMLKTLKGPYQPHVASAYTFAAIPARIALEQQKWKIAASLKTRIPESYPWERYPAMEAITYYAIALGASRSGNNKLASQAINTLKELGDRSAETSKYWAKQVEIQRLSATAWLKYHEGEKEKALVLMTRSAELEGTTEKHPVTPGEILPSRELLADMLFEMGRFKEAMLQYEGTLTRSTNRFNSLYGAGRAAELNGEQEKAAAYYKKLVSVTADESKWVKLQHAKAFLAKR